MRVEVRAGITVSRSPAIARSAINSPRSISNFRFVPSHPNGFSINSLANHQISQSPTSERRVSSVDLSNTSSQVRFETPKKSKVETNQRIRLDPPKYQPGKIDQLTHEQGLETKKLEPRINTAAQIELQQTPAPRPLLENLIINEKKGVFNQIEELQTKLVAEKRTVPITDMQKELLEEEVIKAKSKEQEELDLKSKMAFQKHLRQQRIILLCKNLGARTLYEQDAEVNGLRFEVLIKAHTEGAANSEIVEGSEIIAKIGDLNAEKYLSPIRIRRSDGSWNKTLKIIAESSFGKDSAEIYRLLEIVWGNSAVRRTKSIQTQEATTEEIQKIQSG